MAKFMCLIFLVAIISCNDRNNQNNSIIEVDKQKERDSPGVTQNIYKTKYDPIVFKETRVIKEGDSLIIFGGENGFIKNNFRSDTCRGIVEKVFFTKSNGQLAFTDLIDSEGAHRYLAISLYYLDSKRGYKEAYLHLWNRIPNDDEVHEADLGFPMQSNYETVDLNLGFMIPN